MITTHRLLIRPLESSDLLQVRRVWGDSEVMHFCGGVVAEERLPMAVQACLKSQADCGYSPFAVLARVDGALIGLCGLKRMAEPEGAELIYHFLPSVWGCGYATEAVCAVLSWAEGNLPIHYVEASFDERNTASRHVLDKAGFTYLEDRWYDDVQRTEPVSRLALQAGRRP